MTYERLCTTSGWCETNILTGRNFVLATLEVVAGAGSKDVLQCAAQGLHCMGATVPERGNQISAEQCQQLADFSLSLSLTDSSRACRDEVMSLFDTTNHPRPKDSAHDRPRTMELVQTIELGAARTLCPASMPTKATRRRLRFVNYGKLRERNIVCLCKVNSQ